MRLLCLVCLVSEDDESFSQDLLQLLHDLASRLQELHELGYVHCNLTPEKITWMCGEIRCSIDFDCPTKKGSSGPLTNTVEYAAPETVAAYRRGERTMVAEVCSVASSST